MTENEEKAYIQGERAARLSIILECIKWLGYDNDPEVHRLAWVIERERAVQTLRGVCADFGDNDWPDASTWPM